jgi:hypothetical protein
MLMLLPFLEKLNMPKLAIVLSSFDNSGFSQI